MGSILHEAILRGGQAVILAEAGTVVLVSPLLEELAGQAAATLVGTSLDGLLRPAPCGAGRSRASLETADGPVEVDCAVLQEGGTLLVRVARVGQPDSRELAERLQTVLDISRKMAGAAGTQELLQEITRACHHLVGANDTTIYGLHPDGDRLVPLFTDDPNWSDITMGFEIPLGTGLTGHVALTGQAEVVNDPATSTVVVQVPGTPDEVDEVLMSVPLAAGERVLGVITVSRPLARPFSQADLEIISILAGQAAALLAQTELLRRIGESEQRYRSLVDNAGIGLFRLDPDGRVEAVNPFLRRVLGLAPDEPVDTRRIWGSERACQDFLQELRRQGSLSDVHTTTLTADGRMLDLRVSAQLVPGAGAVEGSLVDDTERRRLELENQARLGFLENLLAQLPLGLVILEPGGRVRHHNPAFCRLMGIPDGECAGGEHVFSRMLRDIPELHSLWISTLRRESGRLEELALPPSLFADGSVRHISLTTVPVSSHTGILTDAVFLLEDVGERRALRNQLIQSQKMDSVGSLASGLAHDFNNILSGILGNSQYLRRCLDASPEAREPLDTIERSVALAAQLTRQLLGFARRDADTLERVETGAVLEQALGLFRRGLKPGVHLEEEPGAGVPSFMADPLQVGQALLNLLLNAADATGESGVISVRTRLRREAPVASEGDAAPMGPWVEFEVQDTGAGIPEDMLPRVFDPFFTTKAKGQGSGLGLAMVYAILQRHGGQVEIQSRVGFGTRVRLLFPAGGAGVDTGTERHGGEGNRGQVWIVDDDAVLREMLRRILQNLRYQTRAFASGQEVLEAVRREPAAADLFILDVLMPGMSGVELLQELRGLRPDPRVLFCSGVSLDQQGSLLELPGVKGFVEKPFSIASLSALLEQALR